MRKREVNHLRNRGSMDESMLFYKQAEIHDLRAKHIVNWELKEK